MKKITAMIRHYKLDDVKQALVNCGVHGMTVTEVRGFGRQRGHQESYRGSRSDVHFVPNLSIEIVVADEQLTSAIAAITKAARTGQVGDGKIAVSDIAEAIRIRTSERGALVL